ncbi:tripartite tricarboxylate transporter substrate binding protein [Agromyces sp. NPDC058484]|uniref:tripartite tricarboxylate transporter substrate binding protein n=1 Tax=Agromyces sp. NPDC058484 TaxID=3346524 RepID=UPI003659582E
MKRLLAPATALLAIAAIALTGCSASAAGSGDDYPNRPINFSVGSEPGSGWDATARALVEVIEREDAVPVQVNVQNRPGAVGCVLLNDMINRHADADNEIAMTSVPLQSMELRGQCDVHYTDVTVIARLLIENFLVAVPADSEFQDLGALLDAIAADPQSVPIAASGDDQLPLALLVDAAGGNPSAINFIEFESGGEYLTALMNGDVVASVSGVTEYGAQIEAGELQGLAVLSEERLEAPLADIPTAVELGYDVTLNNWRGVYGPPNMPDYAVEYWQAKLQELLETPSWQEIADRNQWGTAYLAGDELQTFLDESYAQLQTALESVGAAG